MELIGYIAGPYRAATINGIYRNIQHARAYAEVLWQRGLPCITPHLNTAFLDGVAPDSVFLAGDLLLLQRCDFVLTVDDWERSEGARNEVRHAGLWGIPVFHTLGALEDWLATTPVSRYSLKAQSTGA